MTTDDAELFLRDLDGKCVRFFRRLDATILTDDCPIGVERKRRRSLA
jgi:hypothetical protein